MDVGVGTGSLPVVLERLGFEVHGLDDDGGGQRKASTLALRFPTLRMQVCALESDVYPYEDDFFDAVTSFDVIEHLPGSPRHYLMEIYRVLKPGGVFFLSTPNVASLANRVLLLMGRSIYNPLNEWFDPPGDEDSSEFSGHWREYSVSELVYMVQAVGFQVLEKGCRSRLLTSRVRSANTLEKILYGIADVLTSTIFRGMADEVYVICMKPKA
ncbi:MAG: class I SAM-dependent methyltransferase [Candidatus Methanomethylicaceae archaeon]